MKTRLVGNITAITTALAIACGSKETASAASRFAIEVQVNNDDGDAQSDATIVIGNRQLGRTGTDGALKSELSGAEGQSMPVTVRCPEGFTGPERPLAIRLTHTRRIDLNGFQPARLEVTCARDVHDVIIVVRAQGGAELALNVDGKPAGTTDGDGIAHVLVHASRDVKALNVSLDTSSRPELKPKNSSRTYELAGSDAILLFDQSLVSTPKPAYRSGQPRPRKHIPYRVD